MQLTEFIKGQIWTRDYPVNLAVCPFNARMSVIRLGDGRLMLHSPCGMDDATAEAISKLGRVGHIVAPGSLHHMHVAEAQRRFPEAQTYLCPGVERRAPNLRFDWILGPRSPAAWSDTIDQVLILGNTNVCEVAMLHKPSRTLLLVDSIENYTDRTEDVSWQLKVLWKLVLRMWNKPGPAPEYRFGWKDKAAARASLEAILQWDFDRIVLSHGDNITQDAKEKARQAWTPPLEMPS
jgi:hypothetical protein